MGASATHSDADPSFASADGLALHVVHRDVSPQNVLVGLDGVVRVADFGVAKATRRQQHTEEGSVKGKLAYLAPEQLGGRCDLRADVFAVGAVLWELLTGTRMRTGDGVEMLVGILSGIVPAPSSVVAEAAGLDAVVLRALERCPEERFATAAAMAEAIEQSVRMASPARVAEVVRDLVATPAARSVAQADVAAHADVTSQDVTSEDASNMPTAAIACGRPTSATVRCARTPGPLATFRLPGPPLHRAPHRGFEPLAEPARRIARTSGAPRRAA